MYRHMHTPIRRPCDNNRQVLRGLRARVGPCQPVLAVPPGRACRRRLRRQAHSAPAMPAAAPRAPTAVGAAAVHAGGRRADDTVQHRVLRVDEQLGVRLHACDDHRRRRRE